MTTEGMLTPATEAEPPALYCYRHPDRETWVRCGRCDQPICSRCAMQGPVGFRCRECGRPARDPLTSVGPSQLAIGLGISVLGGIVVGLFSSRIGIFGLLLAWFVGGVIADAVIRFIGFKRGPRMMAALFGGILVGAALAFVGEAVTLASSFGEGAASFIFSQGAWAALAAAIACFGAWSRFRF
ncbi:MAG: hypothetical protein M3Y40_02665 [Chloroflexota bacterium]|nr:hypothetical protein [Chloroflexota bacterium]